MNLLDSLFSILLILICNFGNQKEYDSFSKDGLSFTYSADWSITEQEDLDGDGYYLSVEKTGFNSSGMLAMTWIYGVLNPHEYIEMMKDEYRENKVMKDLKYSVVRNCTFGGIKTISCDYSCSILSVKHHGAFYVFVKGGNTYFMVKNEALEDIAKNQKGFDLIESTFKIN